MYLASQGENPLGNYIYLVKIGSLNTEFSAYVATVM